LRARNNDDLPAVRGRIGTDTIRARIRPTRLYLYNDLMDALGYVPIPSDTYAPKTPVGEYRLRE
jgi:hypothetical protein